MQFSFGVSHVAAVRQWLELSHLKTCHSHVWGWAGRLRWLGTTSGAPHASLSISLCSLHVPQLQAASRWVDFLCSGSWFQRYISQDRTHLAESWFTTQPSQCRGQGKASHLPCEGLLKNQLKKGRLIGEKAHKLILRVHRSLHNEDPNPQWGKEAYTPSWCYREWA